MGLDLENLEVGSTILAKGLMLGMDDEPVELKVVDISKDASKGLVVFNLYYFKILLGTIMYSALNGGSWEWV